MKSRLLKTCSWVLALVLFINLLPVQVFTLEAQNEVNERTEAQSSVNTDPTIAADTVALENATILMEVEENRTEFTKEFKLSNGMYMAIVYPEAVHYEEDGQWKDIDNTLQAKGSGNSATYTTTAGSWHAVFPQEIRNGAQVIITKDGYAVSFGMAGELRSNSASNSAAATYNMRDSQGSAQTMLISEAHESLGQIYDFDYSKEKETAQYPEIVRDKLKSRVSYEDVYNNTDIIYDVNSYQMKESIVINAYDASVHGYLYTLDTGTLVPVLNDDGSIDLLNPNSTEVIMTMPAPFMIDDAGAVSNDILVTLEEKGDCYLLAYQMPMDWLADEDRAWPVVLDPMVVANSSYSNILDQFVAQYYSPSYNNGALMCGYSADFGIMRSFIQYVNLPPLSSADVIVNASLSLQYLDGTSGTTTIEAHKVLSTWDSQTITWGNQPSINETIVEDYDQVSTSDSYYWEITDIVREWYVNGNTGVMLKAPSSVETGTTDNWKKFYSIDYSKYNSAIWPSLTIVYRNMNGLESYWDYTSASAGRAGTGYVNNYAGNLTWVHNDIGFDGNRMPVSISHIYNSNDKETNSFGLGYGWRTNYNQTVEKVTVAEGSALKIDASYVWTDGDGTKHYFIPTTTANTYEDEDGLELILTVSSSAYTITDKYGNTSNFDSRGRLVSMVNNQKATSSITITYTSTTGNYISKITDGAGRSYNFTYSSNLLTRISYTGSGTTEIAYITFGYSSSQLTSITNQDGKSSTYGYSAGLLTNAVDIDGYRIHYDYSSTAPKRVIAITEYNVSTLGSKITIEYAHNQTTFTDHNGNMQITQFNDWGNVISVQDGEGRAQFAQYAMNEYNESGGKGNQLKLSSKLQNTVVNLLNDSSFENGGTWTVTSSSITQVNNSGDAYLGSRYLKLTRTASGSGEGIYGPSFTATAGKTYTFSAYLKTGNLSAYLVLTDGTTTVTSDTVSAGSGYTRVEVSYTATTTKTVTPKLIVSGSGSMHMDCVQIEQAVTASRYNLLQNGDFRTTGYWSSSSGRTSDDSAAPHLSSNVYKITGSPTAAKSISQTVQVSGSAGDTFILSGWAKGDAAPLTGDSREFGLKLTFHYTDGNTSTQAVSFNPDCDSQNSWQYAATPAVASKAYSSVTVEVVYSYNVNSVYFDGIQLFKEEFGNSYTYDAKGNLTEVIDVQKQETKYVYNSTTNNLTQILQDGTAKMTYTYDNYHNVKTATTATGIVYSFVYDTWGNNTSVSITYGSTSITSSAAYTTNGNLLASTTDALGKKTTYSYNANTSVLESVQYPKDTPATRTEYTYDSMYRLTKSSADTDTGNALSASYVYTNDLLTKLTTGSTTYNIAYGNFAQTSSIKTGSLTLAAYTYTADQNHYLSTLDYGNGDKIKYVYDSYGRVTKETFEDGDTVTYQYDNSGALATVTDSATGIKTTYYYDFTDRLLKYSESSSTMSHSVSYQYDDLSNLTALVNTINGSSVTTSFQYDADNRITASIQGNANKTYSYDAYGRLAKRLTKHTSTVTTETFNYKTNASGSPTSQVGSVSIVGGDYSKTYTYTYDANGNITAISDGTYTTTYTYDSANQLISEINPSEGVKRVWTYDDAGNILYRYEYSYPSGTLTDTVSYGYSNSNWGDLLTSYDGKTITYDGIGNPLSDGTWTYAWEHGHELVSMSRSGTAVSYAYNADGLRVRKTVNGVVHNYIYSGDKLIRETYGTTTLDFSYDAYGNPYTLTYTVGTSTPLIYHYVVNLQGDVIRIVNSNGVTRVAYEYDAWGNITNMTYTSEALANANPLRYRGYYYDSETGFYYVSSRYYDPEIGRWINADDTAYWGADGTLLSYNLFAYCKNNPVMLSDPNGHVPEWWQWAISGAIVVAGIALVATGVGGVAGGALICAGANSMIGSYVSEATGGSSVAGWTGGMITGAACGTGAGFAGSLLIQATNATGAACLGNLAAGGAAAFGSGAVGSATGQCVSAAIDGKKLNSKEVVNASMATGAINCLSGLGTGIGTALQGMPLISTTTTTLANSLNAAWSLVSELACDFLGTISSLLPW